jgi:hypothetical protein
MREHPICMPLLAFCFFIEHFMTSKQSIAAIQATAAGDSAQQSPAMALERACSTRQ